MYSSAECREVSPTNVLPIVSNCAKFVKYVKFCQIMPDVSDSTLVRSVLQARYSSQLQLSSGLDMLVRPCGKVTENRAKDFLAFWHECSL